MTLKNIIYVLIIVLISAFVLLADEPEIVAQEIISSDVIGKELKVNFKKIISDIPKIEEHLFGFANKEELSKAELGAIFQILEPIPNLSPVQYLPPEKAWLPTGYFKVAVKKAAEYKVILTFEIKDRKYRGVSLGEPELAKELNDLNKKYKFDDFKNPTRIVSLKKIASDFFIIPDDTLSMDDSKIYPLESARKVFGKQIKHKGKLSKVIKAYHPIMIKYIHGAD